MSAYIQRMNQLYGSEQLAVFTKPQYGTQGTYGPPEEIPMPNWRDLIREEGVEVGPQVKAPAYNTRKYFKPGGLVEPGVTHYGSTGSGQKFDTRYFVEELGYRITELNKAAEHYSKGKIKKFKDLGGPEFKQMRRDISQNLKRNEGKFLSPSRETAAKKIYEKIATWVDNFKTVNNRLPSKVEIADGTGYAVQGSIEAGDKKGFFKTYKGIPPEAAKAGAEKRVLLMILN